MCQSMTQRNSEVGFFRQNSLMMVEKTSKTTKNRRKAKTPTKRILSEKGSAHRTKLTDSASKKVQSRKRRHSGVSGQKSKRAKTSEKQKVVLETPNPKKYRPRWERAIVAAAEKTKNEELVVAESPIKACAPLASPLKRFRLNRAKVVTSPPNERSPPMRRLLLAQSCSSTAMYRAERWVRRRCEDEVNLARSEEPTESSCGTASVLWERCESISQCSEAFSSTTHPPQLRRRSSNLFANMKSPQKPPRHRLLSPKHPLSPRSTIVRSPETPNKLLIVSPKSKMKTPKQPSTQERKPPPLPRLTSPNFYLPDGHCSSPILLAHDIHMPNNSRTPSKAKLKTPTLVSPDPPPQPAPISTPGRGKAGGGGGTAKRKPRQGTSASARKGPRVNRDVVMALYDEDTMFMGSTEFQMKSSVKDCSPSILSSPRKGVSIRSPRVAKIAMPMPQLNSFKCGSDVDSGTHSSHQQTHLLHRKMFSDDSTQHSQSGALERSNSMNTLDCYPPQRRHTRSQAAGQPPPLVSSSECSLDQPPRVPTTTDVPAPTRPPNKRIPSTKTQRPSRKLFA